MSNRRLTLWIAGWVCALACGSLLGPVSAGAVMIFPSLGQISAPGLGFGELYSGSVAVDDFNGHIFVADSRTGLIYDFASASDTKPAVWDGSNTSLKSFGGEEAGGGANRVSVAVDNASGDVYVADTNHMVIDKFDASGTLISTFGDSSPGPNGQLAGTGTPAGSFSHPGTATQSPLGIAVDQATHDLYVIDSGPGHEAIDVFSAEGVFISGKQIVEKPFGLYTCEGNYTDGIAVDSTTGDVFVSDSCVGQVYEFDALGAYITTFEGTETPAKSFGGYVSVAVDDVNRHVFIVDSRDQVVDVFDSSGVYLGQIAGNLNNRYRGVAIDQATGEAYVSDNGERQVNVFGAGIIVPDVSTSAASSLQLTGATLNGTVNSDKEGVATCQFVWGTSEAFGHIAPCSAEVPEGVVPAEVHAEIAGLQPDTEYFYRLQATNKNGRNSGEASQDQHFTTLGVGLHSEFVSAITAESATLDAAIDPNNAPTTYDFQYGTSTGYGTTVPAAPALVGSGKGDVEVSQHLQGLTAGIVHHYRVVSFSEVTPGHVVEADGPDQTFTTQALGTGSLVLDGREWELVSPPDKNGALLEPLTGEALIQASPDGQALTYLANSPTEPEPEGNAQLAQIFSTRGADGWSTRDISIPNNEATGAAIGTGQEYRFFSEDLGFALVEPVGNFPAPSSAASLSSEASELTPYRRADYLNKDVNSPCLPANMHCYTPLVTGAEGFSDVPPGTVFGEGRGLIFLDASPDLGHVVFESGVSLTKTSPSASKGGLYEWSADKPRSERLQLVSVLPGSGGEPASNPTLGSQIGTGGSRRGAISDDGSRVTWEDRSPGGVPALFMRDTTIGETVQLDTVRGGSGKQRSTALFQLATPDGSKVFFTDTQRLTTDSGGLSEGEITAADLYECEMVEQSRKLTCKLTDLTPLGADGESASVQDAVIGSSTDGSSVYFVALGVLTGAEEDAHGERAQSGQSNLYVDHDGVTKLVAVLSAKDAASWGSQPGGDIAGLTARVSPNGRWLAFMSQRSLTGYDNHDVNNGRLDQEVYLYDVVTGRLVCGSCDTTGARPIGVKNFSGESGEWISAYVPGWTSYRLGPGDALYQSRYLSDSGRLFFNSNDALVPKDVDGTKDVYEFEPVGVGNCTVSSQAFEAGADGCVGLTSSGESGDESSFLDASEDGGHVFFLTIAKLAGNDVDEALDVYDAHECSSVSPCFSRPVALPPPCGTGDACKAAPTPQPAIFGAPASSTFNGSGNLASAISGPVVRGKALTRKQKLARALRTCAKQPKRKRSGCRRRVRRMYGAVVKAKKTDRGGK
jgi:hypothetical protein